MLSLLSKVIQLVCIEQAGWSPFPPPRVGIKAQSLCLSNTIVGSVDINVPALWSTVGGSKSRAVVNKGVYIEKGPQSLAGLA